MRRNPRGEETKQYGLDPMEKYKQLDVPNSA